jgi:adenosine deaminase
MTDELLDQDAFNFTDLHRHFGGSISVETVSKVSGISLDEVVSRMVIDQNSDMSYNLFFSKFKILDSVKWNYDNISLTIQDVVWGLKREGIQYAEIKFSINKYLKHIKTPMAEFVMWFIREFEIHSSNIGITVDLVLSLKHDMDKKLQTEIGDLIKNDIIAECIAGIDIVGDERKFDVNFYKPIYDNWHAAKKVCMAHVGEINKPQNVIDAIKILKLDRVCHGIAVADNKEIAKLTRDKLISFDVCITSNICTGVATRGNHPVKKMIENGFIVNIGTDDPAIVDTNMKSEYDLFKQETGLSSADVRKIIDNTINFSAQKIIKRKQK